MNQFTEAAKKLREAADALDAVTIPPMTTRGLPTPELVEPQAGQVWETSDPIMPVVLNSSFGSSGWSTPGLDGQGFHSYGRSTAEQAVRGLTFAAPSVAEYYQAELRSENERLAKRVAELEGQLDAAEQEVKILREDRDAALAKARAEGAQATREERFHAYRLYGGGDRWNVWDNECHENNMPGGDMPKAVARNKAARLNAEHAKERKP